MNEELKSAGSNADINTLLERAFMFLEDGDFENANKYCEKVLDVNPKNAEAYLGKLMAELKVRKQEDLKNLDEPFDNSSNYQKIIRFADEKLKSTLIDYREHINARKENERLANIYNSAHSSMSKGNREEAFKKAAALFESISGYKDADVLAKECYEKAEAARIEHKQNAKKIKKIAIIATSIVCVVIAFVIVLTTVIIPISKYNNALTLMNNGKYTEAILAFEALDGYKDSKTKIDECNTAILETENEIKYNNATALMNAGKYTEAISAFDALDGYKDSKAKIDECKVEKLKTVKVGDYVFFGAYEQDNNTSNGKEYIEWLVLDVKDGKALVVSKHALDCKPYDPTYNGKVTWETCALRKWLNNNFINSAFSTDEKAMIPTVIVPADENPEYSTDPGNATQDKVFLLSITEVNKYFSSDNARQCKLTGYASANGAITWDNGNCHWFLRTPGNSQATVIIVKDEGQIAHSYVVHNAHFGVRPAMWIDLSKIS